MMLEDLAWLRSTRPVVGAAHSVEPDTVIVNIDEEPCEDGSEGYEIELDDIGR